MGVFFPCEISEIKQHLLMIGLALPLFPSPYYGNKNCSAGCSYTLKRPHKLAVSKQSPRSRGIDQDVNQDVTSHHRSQLLPVADQ